MARLLPSLFMLLIAFLSFHERSTNVCRGAFFSGGGMGGEGGEGGEEEEIDERSYYEILQCDKACNKETIKRNYRRLVLTLHPDKVAANATDYERNAFATEFLRVQLAYETLSDPELRLKYDLSFDGVEYDVREKESVERYYSRNFAMYASAKKGKIKMVFEAAFTKPDIYDMDLHIDVDVTRIQEMQVIRKTYHRRVLCSECGGNGGLLGACRTCTLCGGRGFALHSFKRPSKEGVVDFQQVTETQCGSCKGTGCHPVGRCSSCNGEGTVIEETVSEVRVPAWVHNGWNFFQPGVGHTEVDGRVGGVKVHARLKLPHGWSINGKGQLEVKWQASLHEMVHGFERQLTLPWGEVQNVTVEPGTSIVRILRGLEVLGEGIGLANEDKIRGDVCVQVHWGTDRRGMSDETFIQVIESSGYYERDMMYTYLLGVVYPEKKKHSTYSMDDEESEREMAATVSVVSEQSEDVKEGDKRKKGGLRSKMDKMFRWFAGERQDKDRKRQQQEGKERYQNVEDQVDEGEEEEEEVEEEVEREERIDL